MNRFALATLLLLTALIKTLHATPISKATLAEVMEKSGVNDQTAEFPGLVWSGIMRQEMARPSMSRQEIVEMQYHVQKAFEVTLLLKAISEEIKRDLTEEEAQQILLWLESDLARD